MAAPCSCPDRSALESLLHKGGSVVAVVQLEQHLATCAYCGDMVENVLSSDPLALELRGAALIDDESAVRLLQSRLAKLRPFVGVAALGDTLGQDNTNIAAPSPPGLPTTGRAPA